MSDFQRAIVQLRGKILEWCKKPAPGALLRLQVRAPAVNAPAWLAGQSCFPKVLWRDRKDEAQVALVGALLELRQEDAPDQDALAEFLTLLDSQLTPDGGELRCYGGLAFNGRHAPWPAYGVSRWMLPLLERGRAFGEGWLACHLDGRDARRWKVSSEQALAALDQLRADAPTLALTDRPYQLSHLPDYTQWQTRVGAALHTFAHTSLDKVVLARQSKLNFTAPLDPWALIERWHEQVRHSTQFAFAFSPGEAFVGCSPELLFRRTGAALYTEALAGSCARGRNDQDDRVRAQALLDDHKNRHENLLVLNYLHQQLAPLTTQLSEEGELEVLKLARIQHLRHRVKGTLRPGVGDSELLFALHPTPAVGGSPQHVALPWLEREEPEARGWYAGVVAAFGRTQSQAAVAIRSAKIEDSELTLYAGAGIVPGSEPLAEWLELDTKIETVMGLFKRTRT